MVSLLQVSASVGVMMVPVVSGKRLPLELGYSCNWTRVAS